MLIVSVAAVDGGGGMGYGGGGYGGGGYSGGGGGSCELLEFRIFASLKPALGNLHSQKGRHDTRLQCQAVHPCCGLMH